MFEYFVDAIPIVEEELYTEDPAIYLSVAGGCALILISTLVACLIYKRKEMKEEQEEEQILKESGKSDKEIREIRK